jgi:trehalose 6-phosphate phosphatase
MRYILARANREVLEQFACSKMLLAVDFDGTLAPIVTDPGRAAMRASTRRLLRQAATRHPCVVISGRSRADVLRRVRGTGVAGVIGNHGSETRRAARPALRAVRRWREELARRLAGLQGVTVEDKGLSLAVHYRRARERRKARARILAAVADLGRVRLIGGKLVVNVLPLGAPHKGLALEQARARFKCDTAVYVGDDETDEDVFALDQPGRLLTIRVGRKRVSAASYYIRRQAEIDGVLLALAASASRRPARRPRKASA